MTTFTIDAENSITAITQAEVAAATSEGAIPFTSEKDLARLATDWPVERLVEIWNGIPGVKAVTRFKSRQARNRPRLEGDPRLGRGGRAGAGGDA
jgi:hypothetical protein